MHIGLKKRLLDAATAPYLGARFRDYYWARGKLFQDPVFAALLEQQVFRDSSRILDLGCGRGLLAAWLLAAEKLAAEHAWTASFAPPKGLCFRGVELDARTAVRGHKALQSSHGGRVALASGDMRTAELTEADVIMILDALHYIPHADQDRLLDRIRAALGDGGVFITRVGDAEGGWRFGFSQIVDRCIASVQKRQRVSTWCRPLSEWLDMLERKGFTVQAQSMNDGTLFANVLLICHVM